MYLPGHFSESDPEVLLATLRAHPLATLIHAGEGELTADLVPMEADHVDGRWRLQAHVARANPLWRAADGQSVLALFQGPQAYVSPNRYPSKAEHGKVVPTWNYTVVQLHGRLRAIDDPQWVRAFVTRLTERHEGGQPRPWHVADAPGDYIDAMVRAIVGIEIDVSRVEGKFKLSQNRSAADRQGVLQGMAPAAAQAMRDSEQRLTGKT